MQFEFKKLHELARARNVANSDVKTTKAYEIVSSLPGDVEILYLNV